MYYWAIWKKVISLSFQLFLKTDFIAFIKDKAMQVDYGKTQYNCVVDDQVV